MRSYSYGRFQRQASFLRWQFLQDGDPPFTDVLSEGSVAQALTAINACWIDRIYRRWSRCGSPCDSSSEASRIG
jgi:hypothetical protein